MGKVIRYVRKQPKNKFPLSFWLDQNLSFFTSFSWKKYLGFFVLLIGVPITVVLAQHSQNIWQFAATESYPTNPQTPSQYISYLNGKYSIKVSAVCDRCANELVWIKQEIDRVNRYTKFVELLPKPVIIHLLDNDGGIKTVGRDITFSHPLGEEQFKTILLHELSHTIAFKNRGKSNINNLYKDAIKPDGDYLTAYSRTACLNRGHNIDEDYAETLAYYLRQNRPEETDHSAPCKVGMRNENPYAHGRHPNHKKFASKLLDYPPTCTSQHGYCWYPNNKHQDLPPHVPPNMMIPNQDNYTCPMQNNVTGLCIMPKPTVAQPKPNPALCKPYAGTACTPAGTCKSNGGSFSHSCNAGWVCCEIKSTCEKNGGQCIPYSLYNNNYSRCISDSNSGKNTCKPTDCNNPPSTTAKNVKVCVY